MKKLIDADALMKELEREVELADDRKTAHEIANVVKYFPTIVPQRKRGKWIAGPGNTHTCSECGFSMITNNDYIKRHYFCLNCGADMRETE